MKPLRSWRNPPAARLRLRQEGIFVGTDTATGEPIHLPLSQLGTHLHIMGPPGSGKTRFLLWLFQSLIRVRGATVVLINPKGELAHQARDWTIATGQTDRLTLFDPGQEMVLGYNPLRPNDLPVATHAKAVRESIRSAWGQATFDQAPQMARFLYLAILAARQCGLNLVDAAELLRPMSPLRDRVLAQLPVDFTAELLAYLDSLKVSRQEELTASALARLEAFVADPLIRGILTHEPAVDLGQVLRGRRIFIANLELYRPLRADDVRLLGRLLINDVLSHVFARPPGDRGPVYLILDEVQELATTDLCRVLDLGRELGLHCILAHQHCAQLRDEDQNGHLFHSVMNCARTKAVFGGTVEDMELFSREFFVEDFDPMKVKDELTSLELDPHETTREVVGRGTSYGYADGSTKGETVTEGIAENVTRSRSWQKGVSHGQGTVMSSSEASGDGSGTTILPDGQVIYTGSASSGSSHGISHVSMTNTTESEGRQVSHGLTKSMSRGQVNTLTTTKSESNSFTRSTVPFYEYKKSRVVSSRTFESLEEFLVVRLQQLKDPPTGHFAIKAPGESARFLRAPWARPAWLDQVKRSAVLDQLYRAPEYFRPRELEELKVKVLPAPTLRLEQRQEDFLIPSLTVDGPEKER